MLARAETRLGRFGRRARFSEGSFLGELPRCNGAAARCPGIPEQRAYEHFDEWMEEDTYFPAEEELAAVAAAGFDAECVWREAGMAVVVGRKS